METMNPSSTPPQPRKSALATEAPIDPHVPIRTARSFLAIGTLEREERVLLDRCAAYAAEGRLVVKPPVVVMGKPCRQQRNVGFFSDTSTGYRYSGQCMKAQPLGPEMGSLLALVNRRYQAEFNGILVNHYLDGEDYIGAHSDDESALAPGAVRGGGLVGCGAALSDSRSGHQKNRHGCSDAGLRDHPDGRRFSEGIHP